MNKALLVALPLGAGLLLVACQSTRAGYESAPYQVVRADGKFEVRDYPALTIVETTADGANNGFRKLFRFITGQNQAKQKISMTTPVFMEGDQQTRKMAFVMPANLKSVPPPTDASLKVRQLPPGRFVVLRYSGGRNPKREAQRLVQLKAWAADNGIQVSGTPVYGYFDPPWTPGFLRRNEVMLEVRQ